MQFIEHPLIKRNKIESRRYQENILNSAIRKNVLCVLPTGLGKTTIAILLAVHRLDKYPDSKIMITAPTRPLCAQHQKSFLDCLNISQDEIVLLTGRVQSQKRKRIYEYAKIICETPQTIKNDLENNILDISNFSLVVFDEVHRAVGRYAYPFIARIYMQKAKHPRILGLTASPGSKKEKIDEICRNLFIEAVEIRTEYDEDVRPYIKGLKTEFIKVKLSEDLKSIQEDLKNALKKRLEKLKEYNFHIKTKKELLETQKKISKRLSVEKRPILYYVISLLVESIKIWHLLELLETQSLRAAKIYLKKVMKGKTKSDRGVLRDPDFQKALFKIEKAGEHPKIEKLKEVIEKELRENEKRKIIVFSHYRDNIRYLCELLDGVCNPAILIGQAGEGGLSQKEQIEIIKDFNADVYNCLITSPIGEEGLHIPSADIAIFYDSVPSEIRAIQRRGRVGRTKVGKVIFLITKGTRDESYYWSAYRKEKKMKRMLKEMQKKTQPSVKDFLEI
jgi:Fanconi anemia group M protein